MQWHEPIGAVAELSDLSRRYDRFCTESVIEDLYTNPAWIMSAYKRCREQRAAEDEEKIERWILEQEMERLDLQDS